MASLHDLIFSQSSNNATKEATTAEEENALDVFYQQEPTFDDEAMRKKKRRRKATLLGDGETDSQAEERSRKRHQNQKWQEIRWRWKRKKYDLSTEVDYGGAVQHVANRVVNKPKQQEQQEATLTYVDSSDEEKLGSLLNQPPVKPDEVPSQEVEYEKLDYWTKGYVAPPRRPAFTYGSTTRFQQDDDRPPLVLRAGNNAIQEKDVSSAPVETEDDDDSSGPEIPASLMYKSRLKPADNFYVFPIRHATKCPTHGGFFHQRNLVRMAARCAMMMNSASQQNDEDLSSQLLPALHRKSQREAHRINLLLQQARDRAVDFETFHQHAWKPPFRSLVKRELGVGPAYEHSVPPKWINSSLKTDAVKDTRRRHRLRIIRQLIEVSTRNIDKSSGTRNDNSIIKDDETDGLNTMKGISSDTESATNAVEKESFEASYSIGNDQQDVMVYHKPTDATDPTNIYCFPVTSDYIHEPGSSPPVPSFPLDDNNVVFGPPDKHSWMHHTSDVDATTYVLTVSVLLSRLAVAHRDNKDIRKAQDDILSYLEHTVKHISPDHTKFVWMLHHDLPVVPLYMAVMGYCSYFANGGGIPDDTAQMGAALSPHTDQGDYWNEDEYHYERRPGNNTEDSEVATANVVARLIYDRCEDFITDKRLTVFPRVHLTIGIARIVMSLPPSAAEILSRSCGIEHDRTPFELVRSTLEHMETQGHLVDTNIMYSEEETVNVGQLEHTLHLAADLFNQCLEADPTEVIFHEWYIAALAGGLLLCSGNVIGSGAHCRPSSKIETSGYEMLLSQDSSARAGSRSKTHEVRQQMEKFEEVRKLLADAILALVTLSKKSHNAGSFRLHLALSSLFEWGEVIALIIGPPQRNATREVTKNACRQVRRMHAYHTVQWAIKENSVPGLRQVEELFRRNEVTVDAVASVSAAMLENDPTEIANWQRLVGVLAGVGMTLSKGQRRICKKTECGDCKRLRRGLNFDHDDMKLRKGVLGWWGDGRCWWDSQILKPPPLIEFTWQTKPDTIYRVSAHIQKRLSCCTQLQASISNTCHDDVTSKDRSALVGVSATQTMDLNWLRIHVHVDDGSDSDTSSIDGLPHKWSSDESKEIDNEVTYDSDLPTSVLGIENNTSEVLSQQQLPTLVLSCSQQGRVLEFLCYKILLTCHLSGIMQPMVTKCIWFLSKRSSNANQAADDCDEWKCLVWLSALGLNIPQILHDMYVEALELEEIREAKVFNIEERKAIVEGVKRFGRDFEKVRRHSDILLKFTPKQIHGYYRDAVRKGKVNPSDRPKSG